MLINKQCHKCEQAKPISAFYKSKRDKDGYRGMCKVCWANRAKHYKNTETGKKSYREAAIRFRKSETAEAYKRKFCRPGGEGYRERQNKQITEKYGITIAEYDAMFEQQEGNCAICGLPELTRRLSIDHNHETGQVRALLCIRCNFMVGMVESDAEFLSKTIEYVNKYSLNEV